ncbi:hypothetical protein PUN28_020779 [Cardiocondyla obscurior]|uniref:Uncharacterized protein n=1 Tax=Cardiocondyla obscurior TaxID=286306 RepID=A0AAW2E967_9HYME
MILTKNKKKIFEHRAVTSADVHVTFFSVLPSPKTEILTKNENKFLNTCLCDHFQRSAPTKNKNIDEKQKKNFLKIWQLYSEPSIFTSSRDMAEKLKKYFSNLAT